MSVNSTQSSWLSSMKNWLSQVSAVNPDDAKSAAGALGDQAKARGTDSNEISDLNGNSGDSGDIQDSPVSFSGTRKASAPA
jgi:hypothetical protein